MIYFQPHQERQTYSKQHLHSDEFPFFVGGQKQVLLNINGNNIAPAICYESSVPEHSKNAFKLGASVYLVSAADSLRGVEKYTKNLANVAQKYSMTVVMSNSFGQNDNFISAGSSSIWNSKGELVGQLGEANEGVLIFDTDTQGLVKKTV